MLAIYCRTSRESQNPDQSTIDQQKQKGIEFALAHTLEYQTYEDEGISGFKISNDNDEDPFNNRPSFTNMINDIKAGTIDSVWVWEHSRLSRNQYASAYIFNIFEKYKITLYENEKELDLKDPQFQMMRQILDAIAQYERHLIVGRTTRGLHDAINKGKKAKSELYGYQKIGKDKNGYMQWEPVESEINNLKLAYKMFSEGSSLRKIAITLNKNSSKIRTSDKWANILRHHEYTGMSLNIEGRKIYNSYFIFEIENIDILNDKKYWVASSSYNETIISIPDWLECIKRIKLNKQLFKDYKEENNRTSPRLSSGLAACGFCGNKFYYYNSRRIVGDKRYDYFHYKHNPSFTESQCKKSRKNIKLEKLDNIFNLFYFYYNLLFDDTKIQTENALWEINQERIKQKENIKNLENENKQIEKNIAKFNKALNSTDDIGAITVLAKRINDTETRKTELFQEIATARIELEKLNEKYAGTELKNVYESVKDKLVNFFEKYSIEEKRAQLIKSISKSLVFKNYLIIIVVKSLFVFNIENDNKLPEEYYNKLVNDEMYMDYFLDLPGTKKIDAINFEGEIINNWDLSKEFRNESMRIIIGDYLKHLEIKIDISTIDYVVNFLENDDFLEFMMSRSLKKSKLKKN